MANNGRNIDWPVFVIAVVVLLAACVPLALAPVRGAAIIDAVYASLTHRFGVFYLWAGVASLIFLLTIAFSRYGRVHLGAPGERPEFSLRSWASMMFCAGVAAGLFYWGTIEWAYYIDAPPFGLPAGSTEAIEWAATYGMFHWGITGWAIYCLPAVALSYS